MKALYKDSIREIKNKFKIFLSILFMALLGVGFFSGIRATTPDMQDTIDSYFRELNVMDINVLSPVGFISSDAEKMEEIKEVKEVILVNNIDTLVDIDSKEFAVKTITYNDKINKIELKEGTYPKEYNECILDSSVEDVEIGDFVTLKTTDPRFKEVKLKVVGFASSPLYIAQDRGTTDIASGTIDYFMYIHEDNILGDIYTDMYITLEDDLYIASDDYNEYVDGLKNEISKINSNWYVFDINDNSGFASYLDDTHRIENIAKIFPVLFFVVAVLISLTSMTRMVEEQRGEIGTLKALGYSNSKIALKYILYASLATLIGGILGIIIGVNLIPRIIFMMYRMMYDIRDLIVGYNWYYSLMGLIIAYVCIVGAVVYACLKEMNNNPAILMRPKAPKSGKRIFLEKINFIWKKLSFTNKVTCRNMFRYKKRFLMTIIGIMGCTSLIFAGFGLKDSIGSMLPLQYGEIFKYELQIILREEIDNNELEELDANKDISSYTAIRMESATISFNDESNSDIQITVVDDNIEDYISLGKDNFSDGIFLTRKIAKLMGIKENDVIGIENASGKVTEVKVSGIVDNYLRHYIYMDREMYAELFNEESKNNVILVNSKLEESEEEKLAATLLENANFSKAILTSDVAKMMDDTLSNLDYVVWVLIVSAGILALTVLYNLSNVNISERIRELATIKVLGFYDKEVYDYVSRENTVLTVIGIILGLGMGYLLTLIIIKTCELDMLMFPTNIGVWSYIIAALLTIVFTIIVQVMNYFALKRIDMISSLKSIE